MFLNVLRHVLGDYALNLPFSALELSQRSGIPNDIAGLVGRRLATSSETNETTRLNEARIKSLTGGDPITARFLYCEPFTFEPTAKFWLAVNHLPAVQDDSHGYWRRPRPICPSVLVVLAGELNLWKTEMREEPYVDVRCPRCGRLAARATAEARLLVKCVRCKHGYRWDGRTTIDS